MIVEVISGFLGAGKTTLIRGLIGHWSQTEKVAVLVNEFGEVGIDGSLLAGKGTDIVELTSGCICCTLNADLKAQVSDIAETYSPKRLLIEPTGVATTKNILNILRSLSLEEYIDSIRVTLLLDAYAFYADSQGSLAFLTGQIGMADVVVLNKCDLVPPQLMGEMERQVAALNPAARVVPATFGLEGVEALTGTLHQSSSGTRTYVDLNESTYLAGYKSVGIVWAGQWDLEKLRALFESFHNGELGHIVRAKALFLTEDGRWATLDFVKGQVYQSWTEIQENERCRLTVIGRDLARKAIESAIAECRTERIG